MRERYRSEKITIRGEVSMLYLQTYHAVCKANYTRARQKTQVKNGFKLRDCEDFSEVDSKIEPPHINKPAIKLMGNLCLFRVYSSEKAQPFTDSVSFLPCLFNHLPFFRGFKQKKQN